MIDVRGSGSLAWDAPRYANGGAMIHDWLTSGLWGHPYRFAKLNYCQYPGFSIPYHPPVYPALLGLFFAVTGGVSYVGARLFIALCLGIGACTFAAVARRLGVARGMSYVAALLLVLTPEIARWSRDTMSETPALMFGFVAAYCFLRWLEHRENVWCWLAFAAAELAFLSRVTAAGLLPAWFLFMVVTRDRQALKSIAFYVAGGVYLAVNVVWVVFIAQFSKFETVSNVSPTRVSHLSWSNLSFYPDHLPAMVGWGTLAAAFAGVYCVVVLARRGVRSNQGLFWLCWFVSYYAFQLLLAVNDERYFTFAVPALIGLAVLFASDAVSPLVRTRIGPALLAAAFVVAIGRDLRLSHGTVGYGEVSRFLATTKDSGNILVAAPEVSDFIFRYRAAAPRSVRRIVRGDRTLAMRVSDYAPVQSEQLAHSATDVRDVLRRGRIRYLITYAPDTAHASPEDLLAHTTATRDPTSFLLLKTFPFTTDYDGPAKFFVWEYRDTLPSGAGDLRAVVPTAGLDLQCP
jgi:hypothetical protein